jgi:hypothetical protein
MAAAVDLVLQLKEAPAGAELVEQVGQQLVMAVAIAVLRAPVAIADLAVTRCWRGPGAGGGRPAAGARLGVVLASAGTAARRRRVHGGRRRPGAGNGRGAGRRRAARAGGSGIWRRSGVGVCPAPEAAGQQLVCARVWCWPAPAPRRAGGACAAAAVDLVLQVM